MAYHLNVDRLDEFGYSFVTSSYLKIPLVWYQLGLGISVADSVQKPATKRNADDKKRKKEKRSFRI